MESWRQVKWTEAGQIVERLGWEAAPDEDARLSPPIFFAKLRQAGRLQDAAFFLGQALPRYQSVVWAARAVANIRAGLPVARPEADALKSALLWVQDPTEPRRRTAFRAAEKAASGSPERLAAMAVFFSGGTVAPDDCPPVPAEPTMAGRMAASAVVLAAIGSPDQKRALNAALDVGSAMADARDT